MKRIAIIIAAVFTVLMASACSSGKVVYERPQGNGTVTGRSWTVFVYMCGGNEEEVSKTYSDKLRDIMSVEYPENVNVVVQTGGSPNWDMKGVYSDYIQRFEASKDALYLADQSITANMGDYKTLSEFLKWGLSNYKADNYMLIFAGEGGGSIYGTAYDALNDDDSLNLEEISYALSLSGENFDIVGFDSPLMGSLETASSLSTYAQYLVAPQEFQSVSGWDYKGFLEYICVNPSSDAGEIGKRICDTYYAKCKKEKCEADAAMSVVDMSKISTLSQAFDGMAGDMLTATDSLSDYANLAKALDTIHTYGGVTADEGFSNMIDLGDMADKIRPYVGNTSDVLLAALNDAVIYRVCGERQKNSAGLSVYYPIETDNDELQKYMEISVSSKYKEFLKKTCVNCSVTADDVPEDYTLSPAWNTYNEDMQTMEYKTLLDKNVYELNILGNMSLFKDISINVYKRDKSSGEYVLLGRYHDLDSQWDAGIFKDNFNGKMTRLFSKNVTMSLVRRGDDYDIYSVPVIMNGITKHVRILCHHNNGKYEIIGVWNGLAGKNKKSCSGIKKIGFFDSVKPLLSVYDEEHKQTRYITGGSVTKCFSGVGEKMIDNGNYMLEYELTDIYGNKRHGTAVKGNASQGKIQFQ